MPTTTTFMANGHAKPRRGKTVWVSVKRTVVIAVNTSAMAPSRQEASRSRSGGSALPLRAELVAASLGGERNTRTSLVGVTSSPARLASKLPPAAQARKNSRMDRLS